MAQRRTRPREVSSAPRDRLAYRAGVRSFSLVLAITLVACQTAATPGATCSRNADCSAPLVCGHGRCRTECREARDCPTGLRCLLDASGLGSCSLPPESTCAMSVDCGSDLVCGSSQCRTTCTADAQCGLGGACSSGSCVVPISGAPDSRPTTGTGALCGRADGGMCPSGYDCTTAVEATSIPVCRRTCMHDSDCAAEGRGSFCWDGSHCTTPCDPVHDLGCGTEVCGLYSGNPPTPEPMVTFTDCHPPGTIGVDGTGCTSELQCITGTTCWNGFCRRTCDSEHPVMGYCGGTEACFPSSPLVNDTVRAFGGCCPDPTGC
jgi:hypothetical protein